MADDCFTTRNAIIESARLSDADRGLLTADLTLDYGGGYGQVFGGIGDEQPVFALQR